MVFLSKDEFIGVGGNDGYCEPNEVAAIRLFMEFDDSVSMDGISAEGLYTEAVWNFDTKREALDNVGEFTFSFGIEGNTPIQDMTEGF